MLPIATIVPLYAYNLSITITLYVGMILIFHPIGNMGVDKASVQDYAQNSSLTVDGSGYAGGRLPCA
jgi:hypothetical protein